MIWRVEWIPEGGSEGTGFMRKLFISCVKLWKWKTPVTLGSLQSTDPHLVARQPVALFRPGAAMPAPDVLILCRRVSLQKKVLMQGKKRGFRVSLLLIPGSHGLI